MKNFLTILFPLLILIGFMACQTDNNLIPTTTNPDNNGTNPSDTISNRLSIRIGASSLTATLLTNPTVTAFKTRLPMTVLMSELNGNEKLYQFPNNLPTRAVNPGTIQTGDLMLYGSSTLVLFYQTFPTSYSYTSLGRIDNPSGLAAALGSGNVTVTFELN